MIKYKVARLAKKVYTFAHQKYILSIYKSIYFHTPRVYTFWSKSIYFYKRWDIRKNIQMREPFHSNEIIFLSNEMVVGSECFGSFIRI